MNNIKDNLHTQICKVEKDASNDMTYLEWILYVHHAIGNPLTMEYMNWLMDEATNEELVREVEMADELIAK
ncbi:hypothetical protein [Eubacterium oxidoreducens]|uniref:Uncharacterized protein n=1 Tax=Eubacterium oxidoreducens TaxID=1732 RepID=A0A1G6B2L6_EUBOX|nr:hypothetical protein [Eubacterium oxidoreducens]SDB14931.1 hypothetical protein SAMN02910417_01093 [Eubacterium oxidoreducens]